MLSSLFLGDPDAPRLLRESTAHALSSMAAQEEAERPRDLNCLTIAELEKHLTLNKDIASWPKKSTLLSSKKIG